MVLGAQEFLSQYAHSSYLDYSGVVLGNGEDSNKAAFQIIFKNQKNLMLFERLAEL